MLVLTRKAGEAVTIEIDRSVDPKTTVGAVLDGQPVTIWVSQIKGGQVKLGVEAPPSLVILRDELKD